MFFMGRRSGEEESDFFAEVVFFFVSSLQICGFSLQPNRIPTGLR